MVFRRGRFHADIEKAMSKSHWKRLQSKKARVCKVFQIIRAMMTELPGGMNAPDYATDTRIPQTPPLSTMPKPRKPQKGSRIVGTWPQKRQRSPEPQVAKQKGKYSPPWQNPKHQQWHPRGPNKNTGYLKKALEARGVWTLKNKGKHRPQWPANKKL